MLSQDCIIQIFLYYPTTNLYDLIVDQTIALRLLKNLPNTVSKCYFLWLKGSNSVSPPNLIKMALKENNSYIYNKLKGGINNDNRIVYANLLCQYGHRDLLDSILKDCNCGLFGTLKTKDYNSMAMNTIRYQNEDIFFDYFFKYARNYSTLQYCGARNGNDEIITVMVERGAANWDKITHYAAISGDEYVINDVIQYSNHDWNSIACGLAEGGHKEFLFDIISKHSVNYKDIVDSAAKGGHRDIVLSIALLASDVKDVANIAARNGHVDIVYDMVNTYTKDYTTIAINAAEGGCLALAKDMINRAKATIYKILPNTYDYIVMAAAKNGHKDIVLYFFDHIIHHKEVLNYMIRAGFEDIAHSIIDVIDVDHSDIVKKAIDADLDSIVYRLIHNVDKPRTIVNYARKKGRKDLAKNIKYIISLHKT